LGICALLIATKFIETDQRTPKIKTLLNECKINFSNQKDKSRHSKETVIKGEEELLNILGWDLNHVVPIHFVNLFLLLGVIFSTDKSIIREIDAKLIKYLRKYSDFFVDMSLQCKLQ
jgi:hypothetical protein